MFDLFDVVWSIDDFGTHTKDQTEIYDEMTKRLGCRREDIIFYDDNIVAVTTAKKANLTTYGIYDSTSEGDREKIQSLCDAYVQDFRDLL